MNKRTVLIILKLSILSLIGLSFRNKFKKIIELENIRIINKIIGLSNVL